MDWFAGGKTSFCVYLAIVGYVTDTGQTGKTHTKQSNQYTNTIHVIGVEETLFGRHQVRTLFFPRLITATTYMIIFF